MKNNISASSAISRDLVVEPPRSGQLHAQRLDLERPHMEAHLVTIDGRRANLALQQIGLDRAGDRPAKTQAGRATLVMRLV